MPRWSRFGQRARLGCVGAGALLLILQACGGKAVETADDDDSGAGSSMATGATAQFAGTGMILQPGSVGGAGMVPGRPPKGGVASGGRRPGGAGASSGGRPVVVEAGAPSVGGVPSVGGEAGFCEVGGASPGCDFGQTCARNADCRGRDCYVPGTGENPICSQRCATNADCPSGSACTGPFGDEPHCFVLCQAAAECQAINSNPVNPLDCVDMADPRAPQGQTVCAQSSEP